MAKRKNLFLPAPRWTIIRFLRIRIVVVVIAAACAASWLGYFALTPIDVVDAYGRAAKQVEIERGLIAVEWLVAKEEPNPVSGPSTWGMLPPQHPKR